MGYRTIICTGLALVLAFTAGRHVPVPEALATAMSKILPQSHSDMRAGETGMAREIVDGDTLFLDSGLKVRLAGMQAPKLSLGRDHVTDWPLGAESKAALQDIVAGKRLQLFYNGAARDRYDRALAQLWTLDAAGQPDIWVQRAMVAQGMARVYTWPDTHQDTDALYAAERIARDGRRGMWALKTYRVRTPDPDPLAQDVDSYQIVQGVVTSVADRRDVIYLNFGADYKTDFTIAIARKDKRRIAKSGVDLMALEGAMVRVRGWIELTNGPMIWLDHAERLEVLD